MLSEPKAATSRQVRDVLRFLRDHPWSTHDEIIRGCGLSRAEWRRILLDDVQLRVGQRKEHAQKAGRGKETFALAERTRRV